MNNVNVNVTVNVNEIAIDINEADEILEDLQALTSLLFALADSAEGGVIFKMCSENDT